MAGCRRFPVTSGCRTFLADDPASGVHLGVEGGILCQLLRSPDYNLFPKSAVFESNFIQVTKQGNWVDILNAPTLVTLGVTSSEPCLPLPNVLLIARLAELGESPPGRAGQLLPLRYVRLSVQDSARRLLRVQVVTGKVYYLRLHQAHPDAVFTLWSRLADILQWGLSITTKDPSIHVPHSLVLSVGSSSTSSSAQVHLAAWCQGWASYCQGHSPISQEQAWGKWRKTARSREGKGTPIKYPELPSQSPSLQPASEGAGRACRKQPRLRWVGGTKAGGYTYRMGDWLLGRKGRDGPTALPLPSAAQGGKQALAHTRTNVISLSRDSSPGILRLRANLLPGKRNRVPQVGQEVRSSPTSALSPRNGAGHAGTKLERRLTNRPSRGGRAGQALAQSVTATTALETERNPGSSLRLC
uniref:Golgi associated RAB2 interactor 1B n=1 Tax=Terrapene triunguis TaxID=2587831 RepID=A0A674JDU1_9SAUR